HMALGNVDTDAQLEVVSVGDGLRVYEPFPANDICPARGDEITCEADTECRWRTDECVRRQGRRWFSNDSTFGLDRSFRAGAPALTDLDADGQAEIVISTAVIDAATGTGLVRCAEDGGGNNDGQQWYISAIADTDLDGRPEILSGNRAYEIVNDAGGAGWTCTEDWLARQPDDDTTGLGAGFPGVGNFVDNQDWPMAPEPETACDGLAESECIGSCAWNGTECLYSASAGCATVADESECNGYIACTFTGDACIEDVAATALYPVDRDYPEVVSTRDGRVYIVHGATGRVMPSPADGVTALDFSMFTRRGGAPNVADFDGDGRVEVSYASTGCMAVFDPDCAVESTEARLGEYTAAVEANCGDSDEWQHPLCEVCAADPNDTRCMECPTECENADAVSDGCPAECISLPVGCAQSPRASHGAGYETADGELACGTDTVPELVRGMVGVLWMRQSQDASSAATGTSVFDFQGDGKAEVLYGDECFFRVYNGENGSLLFERPNSHRTATEYPIVVDVDGDSQSEILVGSNSDQAITRDRCGGGPTDDRAYRRAAGTFELYTPAYCASTGAMGPP
ncbi:MAG: hypothetical protein AAFY60_11355, partial [Myxococcota bacterium]